MRKQYISPKVEVFHIMATPLLTTSSLLFEGSGTPIDDPEDIH